MKIEDVIRVLRNAVRQGDEKDEPEGSRYITISETLAEQMADCLERRRS